MLAQVAGMIEAAVLQIGARGGNFGQGRLRQESSVTSSTVRSTTS
jgi:hypothetical protein